MCRHVSRVANRGDAATATGEAYCGPFVAFGPRFAQPMIAAVVLYFVIAAAVLAMLLLPNLRAQASGWVQRWWSGHSAAGAARRNAGALRAGPGVPWFGRHRAGLLGAAAVLVAAPLLALGLRGWLELDGYDHRVSREVSAQVALLLAGEQLVPPPPVPPELFATREVEAARPLIRFASREWTLLDAEFRKRLLVVHQVMRERHGYEMVLLEGYRGPQRQAELAALGPDVTRARPFESWHQYGLAALYPIVVLGAVALVAAATGAVDISRADWHKAGIKETQEKGFQDAGMNSFNHYAYGAIGDWLNQLHFGITAY